MPENNVNSSAGANTQTEGGNTSTQGTNNNSTTTGSTTGANTNQSTKTEAEIREELKEELRKEYEKIADKRVTEAQKKWEKSAKEKAEKEKMSEEERKEAEEKERQAAQAKKDLELTIKGLKLDAVDAIAELGLDNGFRNLISLDDLASIADEEERREKLTERIKSMKALFDAEVAKQVEKVKAELLKGSTPPDSKTKSGKSGKSDAYNEAKKAGDVKGMLQADFYGNNEE